VSTKEIFDLPNGSDKPDSYSLNFTQVKWEGKPSYLFVFKDISHVSSIENQKA